MNQKDLNAHVYLIENFCIPQVSTIVTCDRLQKLNTLAKAVSNLSSSSKRLDNQSVKYERTYHINRNETFYYLLTLKS